MKKRNHSTSATHIQYQVGTSVLYMGNELEIIKVHATQNGLVAYDASDSKGKIFYLFGSDTIKKIKK